MRDIGALIWGLLVIIGVISSIVQSAKRARVARGVSPSLNSQVNRSGETPARPATGVVQQPAQLPPRVAALLAQFEQQAQPIARPAQPAPPQPAPAAVPVVRTAPVPAPQPVASPALVMVEAPRRTPRLAAFGDRNALMRAIVAAEVLGKPIALRDE